MLAASSPRTPSMQNVALVVAGLQTLSAPALATILARTDTGTSLRAAVACYAALPLYAVSLRDVTLASLGSRGAVTLTGDAVAIPATADANTVASPSPQACAAASVLPAARVRRNAEASADLPRTQRRLQSTSAFQVSLRCSFCIATADGAASWARLGALAGGGGAQAPTSDVFIAAMASAVANVSGSAPVAASAVTSQWGVVAPTPSPPAASSGGSSSPSADPALIGAIVGAVVGFILLMLLIVLVVLACRRRQKQQPQGRKKTIAEGTVPAVLTGNPLRASGRVPQRHSPSPPASARVAGSAMRNSRGSGSRPSTARTIPPSPSPRAPPPRRQGSASAVVGSAAASGVAGATSVSAARNAVPQRGATPPQAAAPAPRLSARAEPPPPATATAPAAVAPPSPGGGGRGAPVSDPARAAQLQRTRELMERVAARSPPPTARPPSPVPPRGIMSSGGPPTARIVSNPLLAAAAVRPLPPPSPSPAITARAPPVMIMPIPSPSPRRASPPTALGGPPTLRRVPLGAVAPPAAPPAASARPPPPPPLEPPAARPRLERRLVFSPPVPGGGARSTPRAV